MFRPDMVNGRADITDNEVRNGKTIVDDGFFNAVAVAPADISQRDARAGGEFLKVPAGAMRLGLRSVGDQRPVEISTNQ